MSAEEMVSHLAAALDDATEEIAALKADRDRMRCGTCGRWIPGLGENIECGILNGRFGSPLNDPESSCDEWKPGPWAPE